MLAAMSVRAFSEPAARERVSRAVAEIEARTSAELVVAVQPSSGHYRHADYAFGALVALVATLIFVFHPWSFRSDLFPIELALSFALGALLAAYLPQLRRLLVSKRLARQNVERAAKAAFYDLGVSGTRGRTGVLVFVSMFERDAAVISDLGVVPEAGWADAVSDIRRAARRADLEQFMQAVSALAPLLEQALPRAADDVDELPNELRVT
jgi:putative membrane protein